MLHAIEDGAASSREGDTVLKARKRVLEGKVPRLELGNHRLEAIEDFINPE